MKKKMRTERYVVRHEYFGGLVYDRKKDLNFLIDCEFFELLATLVSMSESQINQSIEKEVLCFLKDEGFLDGETIDYKIINNTISGETLSAPGRVHFYYTSACNLNCAHCYTRCSTGKKELKYDEKIALLDQMCRLGINEILIGGGEPFVKSDFPDFVEACLERNISTKVYTNGILLNDRELVKRIAKWDLKFLSVSIDGADEEEYEKTRGIKGLSIIKESLKMLNKECSFKIDASVTVNCNNYKNAEKLLALIADLGFDRVKIRPVKPAGNALNNEVFLTAEQYIFFIKQAQTFWNQKYKDTFKIKFSWGDVRLVYDPQQNVVIPIDTVSPYQKFGCYAGNVNVVIDSSGNVIPCGFLPEKMGKSVYNNLRKKSIKEVWDNGDKFSVLRNLEGNKTCRECEYYGVCRGGCITRKLFFGLDANAQDPWCLKKYFPVVLGS